jgi:transcriptional regulator with XRE-family HTH domain
MRPSREGFKRGRPDELSRRKIYVREWRNFRGFSQGKLAGLAGVTHSAISQLENGQIGYTQRMLECIAESLRCEPGDLIRRAPDASDALPAPADAQELIALWEAAEPEQRSTIMDVVRAVMKDRGRRTSQ